MNIVLTNDDGYQAAGLVAAFEAIQHLGTVHVVAPKTERSACSHTVTLRRPVTVERVHQEKLGTVFAVDGTPADCVRLAFAALVEHPINLVVSGVNHGANTGVDTFYSGTVAGAREAAILGIHAVALSLARRVDAEPDWPGVSRWVERMVPELLKEALPGPGFWNVNFPAVVPTDAKAPIQRVPLAIHPMPMSFDKSEQEDGRILQFDYGASYWLRDVTGPSDYSVVRDGGIAVTAIPLYGKF
ncbi:MAG: 5'/3'-nucleotidase SurE [Planctomycetes bacterium]|nr:5'/3'-nucleotidase SurE [Planctomycetota bacterium]MBI3833515.1 5'/3'-nucleotidase SurE [Planctomycetota bacterium]